jgi:protein transport protein SEC61 subunit gamma-like protein
LKGKIMEEEKPTWKTKIKAYLRECWRVLRITKKPSNVEFQTIVKVSGLGIAIIGVIGFLISMIKQILF